MRVQTALAALFLVQFWGEQALAQMCSLTPALLAIDTTAEAVLQNPTSINVAALEVAVAGFEDKRSRLNGGVTVASPIERYIASRLSIALTFRTIGPEGVRQLAASGNFASVATGMRALVSELTCPETIRAAEAGLFVGAGGNGQSQDENNRYDDTAALNERTTSTIASGVQLLSNPASVFAIIVVTAIFAGLIFVAVRRRRRNHPRFICFLPVDLVVGHAINATHVIEISQSGAKVSVSDTVQPDTVLSIVIDGEPHEARAVWSNASCAGVQFSAIIPSQQFAELLDQNGGGYEREITLG